MARFVVSTFAVALGLGCFAGLALGIGFAGMLVTLACR